MATDTIREPRVGLATGQDSAGAIVVQEVQPGGVAQEAGVQDRRPAPRAGRRRDHGSGLRRRRSVRASARTRDDSLPIRVRRGTDTLTLHGKVRLVARVESRLETDPSGEREGGAGAEWDLYGDKRGT